MIARPAGILGAVIIAAGAGMRANGFRAPEPTVRFSKSETLVKVYDFAEVSARVSDGRPRNGFTDASLSGWFMSADGQQRWSVEGFCDAADGSLFRVRFMPPRAGEYRYHVVYTQGSFEKSADGTFRAAPGPNKGPIRIDSANPWHFVWEGTGDHYFFNGTTAYWLFGWRDDSIINASLDRLHKLKINRVRVTVAGRTNAFYGEPVRVGPNWTLLPTPWPATTPADVFHPGFDYTRFDLPYWQKIERGLRSARERGMIISLVLDMNDSRSHPVAGSEDERRFIRYAINRLGAFSNVTWDLGDDLNGFRDSSWAEATGRFVQQTDPYRHLITTHPGAGEATVRQPRRSEWVGFTSFQEWGREQHKFMLSQRAFQKRLGRIMPQTNEEYGYEGHYPTWVQPPPADSPDVLRRMAWEIYMAGGYQLTGETAKRGTNVWPDSGGGWINGRGDATMTMLVGYSHIVDFFTSFEWWKADPHDELVSSGAYCLAQPGNTYVVYLPRGAAARVRLMPGRYRARSFNPLTGAWTELPTVSGSSWTTPKAPTAGSDWALLLLRV